MFKFFSFSFVVFLFYLPPALGALNQSEQPTQLDVYLEQNIPFSTFDSEGNAKGILADYWNEWSIATEIPVKLKFAPQDKSSFLSTKRHDSAYSGFQKSPGNLASLEKQRLFVINSHFYYQQTNYEQVTSALKNDNSSIIVGGLFPQAEKLSLFLKKKNLSYKEYPGLLELIIAVYFNEIDAAVLFEGEQQRNDVLNKLFSFLFEGKLLKEENSELFAYVPKGQTVALEWIDWGGKLINNHNPDQLNIAIAEFSNSIWGVSADMQINILFTIAFIILFFMFSYIKRRKDRQFKTLLDDSPYPVAIFSSNGRSIYYLNDEVQSLFPTNKKNNQYFFDDPENQILLSEFISKANHKVIIESELIHLLVNKRLHDIEVSAKKVYYKGKSAWVCYLKDVHELLQAERQLIEERELLRKVLDSIPEQILFKSPKGTIVGCNKSWANANNTTVIKAEGKRLADIIPADLLNQQQKQELVVWAGKKSANQEWLQRKGDELSLINTIKLPLYNNQEEIFALLSIESDLTDSYNLNKQLVSENLQRKETEAALSKQNTLLSTVFAASLDPIGLLDHEGRVIGANNAFAALMGYNTSDDLFDKLQCELLSADRSDWAERQNKEVLESETPLIFDEMIFSNGKKIWYEVSKTPFKDEESDFQGVVIMARDITLYKQTEEKLTLEASDYEVKMLNDQLTGIANRRAFDLHFERLWKEASNEEELLSLVMCDIDFFKPYNDNYGHQKGDQALFEVAQALQNKAEELGYFVARYGGEEFVVLIKGGNATNALKVAEVLRESIEEANIEHLYSSTSNTITMSMGLSSLLPSDFNTKSMLLAEADSAMYNSKKYGRNQISVH